MKILKNKKILLSIGIAIMVHSFANAQAVSANVNGVVTQMTSSDDRTYGLLAASTMGKDLALATRSSNGYIYPRLTAKYETGNIGIGTQNPTTALDIKGNFKIYGNVYGDFSAPSLAPHALTGGFTFYTGAVGAGIPRFAITNTGNVGIGTQNPIAKLMVNGIGGSTIDFQTTGRMKILSANAGTWLADQHNNDKAFYGYETTIPNHAFGIWTPSAGWSPFNILQNGNVGIGTQNPTAKLMVNGSGGGTIDFQTTGRMKILSANAGTWLADQNNRDKAFYGYETTIPNHAFGIWTPSAGWSPFNILQNGNVGIGTTAPNAPLQFGNSVANRKIVLYEGFNNNHEFMGFGINDFTLRYQVQNIRDSHVFFAASSDTSSKELMRIQGNGNVGIGTTAPNAPLQFGNSVANRKIVLYEGSNNNHEFMGFGINDFTLRYQVQNIRDSHVFFAASSDTSSKELMRIQGNGNVGIGTESPTSKLSVKGTVTALDFAIVAAANMPDYVFAKDYKLPTLSATEAYIKVNKHLPAFKSAKEMEEKGYNVIDMDRNMLQTIEEMTLHAIAQEKTIATQEQKMNAQEAKLINLSQELAEIKALLQNKK